MTVSVGTVARTVREKIAAGCYTVKWDYPTPPTKPAMLGKRIEDLTVEQLPTVARLLKDWQIAQAQDRTNVSKYTAEHGRLLAEFTADLLAENGIPADSVFGSALFNRAWEDAHAVGLAEVVNRFESLVPLWVLYRDKKAH